MPQMSPMWWMSLMLMFNSMIMLSISMMYFNYKISFKLESSTKKTNMIWKW
uniref:ATP synthase F0 subunit 8 n=1 Tax=Nondenticentrus paramelanicus TaxID=3065213 RepID=A0AA95NP86_9HEMI|nr:ATP synthase F0 subunit 8 [Nondenticentrus paramelanicus]WKZ08087.1 ATP synthase F0 subunit 8 [Nondenticentrus paramelanicus]